MTKISEPGFHSLFNDSVNKFKTDAQKELMKIKTKSPDEFIIKWLLSKEEGKENAKTKEEIEKDLPKFKEELKWHSIKSYFFEESGGKITRDDENLLLMVSS